MTSCFHTWMEPMIQNQARRCLEEFARWWYQLDVRQLQCLIEFIRMRHRGQSLLSTIASLLHMSCMVCSTAAPRHVLRCGGVRLQSQDVAGTRPRITQTTGTTCQPPGARGTHPHLITVQVCQIQVCQTHLAAFSLVRITRATARCGLLLLQMS